MQLLGVLRVEVRDESRLAQDIGDGPARCVVIAKRALSDFDGIQELRLDGEESIKQVAEGVAFVPCSGLLANA